MLIKSKFVISVISMFLFIFLFNACQDNGESRITDPATDQLLEKDINEIAGENSSRINRLIEYLELTDLQVEQIKEFIAEQREGLREQFINHKGKRDRAKIREMIKELREEFNDFLMTILTDEQKVKFEELIDKIKNGEFANERFEKWFAKISEALNLTDDQIVQVKAIFQERAEKIKELKAGNYDKKELRELIKGVMEKTKEELAKVLTPEQLEKLQMLLRNHRGNFGHQNGGNKG